MAVGSREVESNRYDILREVVVVPSYGTTE